MKTFKEHYNEAVHTGQLAMGMLEPPPYIWYTTENTNQIFELQKDKTYKTKYYLDQAGKWVDAMQDKYTLHTQEFRMPITYDTIIKHLDPKGLTFYETKEDFIKDWITEGGGFEI